MVEFQLVKLLGPVAGSAVAAFILCLFAGLSNFPIDGLNEVMIRKAIALQFVETVKNIVGVHVSLEFA